MHWVNITAAVPGTVLEELETWFWDHGALAVTVEDGKGSPIYEPPPGEQPVWEEILVTGMFAGRTQIIPLQEALGRAGYGVRDVSRLDDRPWQREWLKRFRPMRFGRRLWVCPSGHALDSEGKVVVNLDPGLAFGTGVHETTRLCLEYLDAIDLHGWRVIDYGCGSGILAIAALLLGAEQAVGVDNDPQALTASEENAARNDVALEVTLPGQPLAPAELLLANILARPLIDLFPLLKDAVKPGGLLVLSGMMSDQAEQVAAVYRDGAECIDQAGLGDWVRQVWRVR